MDANGTHFQLLLGADDWANCMDEQLRPLSRSWASSSNGVILNESGVDWNEERAEVTLQERLFQFIATPKDTRPFLRDRRGAARDRYGNWYWIDETGHEILVNSSGTSATTHFWSSTDRIKCHPASASGDFRAPEPAPTKVDWTLSGLAITEDHYLVTGVQEPSGLLIFDLHAGAAPRQLLWPAAVKFAPFDMTPAPNGGIYVLDRNNQRYWALDRYFNIIGPESIEGAHDSEAADDFQSDEGGPTRYAARSGRARETVTDDAACPLNSSDAIAIEALPDGTVLILDGDPDVTSTQAARFSLIHRYRLSEELGTRPASTDVMLDRIEGDLESFSLVGYDFAFVPNDAAGSGEEFLGHLYVVERNGNQSYAFLVRTEGEQLVLKALADYLPMRLFAGRALVAADLIVYYDFENQWVPLVSQSRPRHVIEATIFTPLADEDAEIAANETKPRGAFDGREPDCVWHRLMLDACIPPEAEVQVWSRAANDQRELALAAWQPEPNPYLRGDGSELPFASRAPKGIKGLGTWELLFQNARGRFLQLQLRLKGNGRATPRLRALRAYYPRFSYLHHYLPAVYREDDESASFLDRFLANVEGTCTAIEDRIAAAQVLFDTGAAPSEALDWLAAWFGIALDPAWDEQRKRVFIKHAIEFFNCRGTMRGLEIALRVALDTFIDESIFDMPGHADPPASGIRIVEKYRTRLAASVGLGDPTDYDPVAASVVSTRWLAAQTASGAGSSRTRSMITTAANFQSRPGACRCRQKANQPLAEPTKADKLKLEDGAAAIASERQRWQTFLMGRYASIDDFNATYGSKGEPRRTTFSEIPLPSDLPPQGAPLDNWLGWLAVSSPTVYARERKLWQDFLARRYRLIATLNRTYDTRWANFEAVSLPNAEPTGNLAAQDWQLFAGVVLAMQRRAHQFTVLLPVPLAHRDNQAALDERRARAERIINLEKPTHTNFEVKFYWAAFRLGEARLGTDTIVDRGSRMLNLIHPMVMDQTYLAEGYLASRNPPDLLDRQIIGRTRLGQ